MWHVDLEIHGMGVANAERLHRQIQELIIGKEYSDGLVVKIVDDRKDCQIPFLRMLSYDINPDFVGLADYATLGVRIEAFTHTATLNV